MVVSLEGDRVPIFTIDPQSTQRNRGFSGLFIDRDNRWMILSLHSDRNETMIKLGAQIEAIVNRETQSWNGKRRFNLESWKTPEADV
jgi:hypothetical protein